MTPSGTTPMAYALREAWKDFAHRASDAAVEREWPEIAPDDAAFNAAPVLSTLAKRVMTVAVAHRDREREVGYTGPLLYRGWRFLPWPEYILGWLPERPCSLITDEVAAEIAALYPGVTPMPLEPGSTSPAVGAVGMSGKYS